MVEQLQEHLISLQRYAFVLTRSREEAEDLVQESLAKAIASAAQWRPGTDLRAWLFRIMHNTHVSAMRRRQVRRTAEPDLEVLADRAASDGGARLEAAEVVAALGRLPDAQRQAIVLIALEDITYGEAAERLGVPVGTFMSRLSRGRDALRRMLGEHRPRLRLVGDGR
jgi:RNA polymerase sigma-70 factor (ECF subfamily)